jgi:hypothetical protein
MAVATIMPTVLQAGVVHGICASGESLTHNKAFAAWQSSAREYRLVRRGIA